MSQGLIDFFAAVGMTFSKFLVIGLQQNATWFWLCLAGVGILMSIAMVGLEQEDPILVVKHALSVLLSAILLFGYMRVDTAEYSYLAKGRLEAETKTSAGAAIVPTYLTFLVGRGFASSVHNILGRGESNPVPNFIASVDVLTHDPSVLDDDQLKANLVIWNQVVAPYLLRRDPQLERDLIDSGAVAEFMVPIPAAAQYVGDAGERAAKVRDILAKQSVTVGEAICTLGTIIDTEASRLGATSWKTADGSCASTTASIKFVDSVKRPATLWNPFSRTPKKTWQAGQGFAKSMMDAGGVGTDVVAIGTFADLYERIGSSVLFVAGNRYAADSDSVVTLGTACDKLVSDSDPMACANLQYGLVGVGKGIVAENSVKPIKDDRGIISRVADGVGNGFSWLAGWGTTSIFRIVMVILSNIVQSVMPFVMGMVVMLSFPVSIIGVYMLCLPRRFKLAMDWMIGPAAFAGVWVSLYGIWVELDPWLMVAMKTIGSVFSLTNGSDRMMGTNVMSILISLGYLAIPFVSYSVVWGSAGKAIAKTTNFSQRMVEAGMVFGAMAAKLGVNGLKALDGKSSAPSGGSGGSGGGGAGGGSGSGQPGGSGSPAGSSPPPSSAPRSAVGGTGPSSGGASSSGPRAAQGGAGPAASAPPSSSSPSGGQGGGTSAGGASSAPSSATRSNPWDDDVTAPPSTGSSSAGPAPAGAGSSAPPSNKPVFNLIPED